VLDLSAERRRFRKDNAGGFPALSAEWFNLLSSMNGTRVGPGDQTIASLPENPRVVARATGALLRSRRGIQVIDTAITYSSTNAVFQWRQWQVMAASNQPPSDWDLWLRQSYAIDRMRNGGTAGTRDEEFHRELVRFMERHNAPAPARDVVRFRNGISAWSFGEAAAAGERLIPHAQQGRWIPPDELRDGLVIARLHLRDVRGARQALDSLFPLSRRPVTDLRSQLLMAYVQTAERLQAVAVKP
jgi:hypothetical protein